MTNTRQEAGIPAASWSAAGSLPEAAAAEAAAEEAAEEARRRAVVPTPECDVMLTE